MPTPVDLEPPAKAVVDANANPYLFELGPDQGRRTIDAVQSGPVKKLTVDIEDTTVPGGPSGQVSVRILRPQGARRPLAVIAYLHGAGWVFGNYHTHDRLIRELAVGAQAAVVFPNYSLAPRPSTPRPSRSAVPWPGGSPHTGWSVAWTPAASRSPAIASAGP
jgi:acetyl esterase/lipase